MNLAQLKKTLISLAEDDSITPMDIEEVISQYIVGKPIVPEIDFLYKSVVRCSPNLAGEVFDSVSRCSYNPDPKRIKLQRCNYSGQQVFYAAVTSNTNIEASSCSLLETLQSSIRDRNVSRCYATLSKWILSRPLRVSVLPFSKSSIKKNKDFQTLNEELDQLLKNTCKELKTDYREIKGFLSFMSGIFCRRVKAQRSYKISSAYCNSILNYAPHLDGLIYPSASTEADGMSIVLRKELVDTGVLKVELALMVAMQRDPSNPKHIYFEESSSYAYPDEMGKLFFRHIF